MATGRKKLNMIYDFSVMQTLTVEQAMESRPTSSSILKK